MATKKIIYTKTDEAPALATLSFLPVIKAFSSASGVSVELRDISLAGRIISAFPEFLQENQRINNDLAELGDLVKSPDANIIKLPNISASIPQLEATIEELQAKGYALPSYPGDPSGPEEEAIKARYDAIKGSAVNPVLREGNSDRRAPAAVKQYAKNNPHPMGAWSPDSTSHVSSMSGGDFASNEQSVTIQADGHLTIEHHSEAGEVTVLKSGVPVLAGEIVDSTFMSKRALTEFLRAEVADAKSKGVLFSLHMKATMMKVSDPIIFGHAVEAYFADVFDKHADTFDEIGYKSRDGLGDLIDTLSETGHPKAAEINADIAAALSNGPDMAMVNSDKGITNLHVPSDVIIDASMPAMIRASGQMWNGEGKQQDTKAVIPDSSYASLYHETINYCRSNGAFDPSTMGTVPNVGLMAQKAEEYGSHDKTFEIASKGVVKVVDDSGAVLSEHSVEPGDIWRACQVKDLPVQDWVALAIRRARATGWPAVFWLDENRPHDAELIKKVKAYLSDHDTDGLQIEIMSVSEATRFTLDRVGRGDNTISVTGNVLRDYLTDLFPILEVGTSAKMLSIVPLMNGGGLFETGAGGSAPKHVQQFEKENHLRWDSLGEFLALAASLEHLSEYANDPRAKVLADALDEATATLLENRKSPSRKVNELDNRGSHFYLAMYWAKALAEQSADAELSEKFGPLAETLSQNEEKIVDELNSVQGQSMDIGGYYFSDADLGTAAMRPSPTFNAAIDGFSG